MYSTTHNHVTFFTNLNGKNTEKMFSGRVSRSFKTDRKDESGKDIYDYENWDARFVGEARGKAAALADKARITLTKWSARRQPYTVEVNGEKKKRYFDYLMVMDFEVQEQGAEGEQDVVNEDGFVEVDDSDGELPF